MILKSLTPPNGAKKRMEKLWARVGRSRDRAHPFFSFLCLTLPLSFPISLPTVHVAKVHDILNALDTVVKRFYLSSSAGEQSFVLSPSLSLSLFLSLSLSLSLSLTHSLIIISLSFSLTFLHFPYILLNFLEESFLSFFSSSFFSRLICPFGIFVALHNVIMPPMVLQGSCMWPYSCLKISCRFSATVPTPCIIRAWHIVTAVSSR